MSLNAVPAARGLELCQRTSIFPPLLTHSFQNLSLIPRMKKNYKPLSCENSLFDYTLL